MNFSRASLGRGFSLMELMIAISVMGILVVSAAPA
ncbi:MAG TPA: type II secretion system protein GspG, partial [Gammaproteobacteria bacterium]|nr:type II secretion system protein GspG [Gammaproteobacteria bacterium]